MLASKNCPHFDSRPRQPDKFLEKMANVLISVKACPASIQKRSDFQPSTRAEKSAAVSQNDRRLSAIQTQSTLQSVLNMLQTYSQVTKHKSESNLAISVNRAKTASPQFEFRPAAFSVKRCQTGVPVPWNPLLRRNS